VFGRFELTPILEEYNIAIEMPLGSKLARPPISIDPLHGLVQLLRTETHFVREILKANHNTCSLLFLIDFF